MTKLADDSSLEIHTLGHRVFVGGDNQYWDSISSLQFDFLRESGLQPSHEFVDIACGSLRGGVPLINYLDADRYHGIDKHIDLIIYGVTLELGVELFRRKRPRFAISDQFEFEKLGGQFDFGIAQSLFTHLSAADCRKCLRKLRASARTRCRIFVTFFEADEAEANPLVSHSHAVFRYTRDEMAEFAGSDWKARYIGSWNHPRGQHIVEYVAL